MIFKYVLKVKLTWAPCGSNRGKSFNMGPRWVPNWKLSADKAHMGPVCACLQGKLAKPFLLKGDLNEPDFISK